MSFKVKVNYYRRRFMRFLTKNIGENSKVSFKTTDYSEIKKVLLVRPNHRLGNQLLLTPLVQEVINTFPECKIDLFVKGGVANPVFENYNAVGKIKELPKKPFKHIFKYIWCWISIKKDKYDLVINADKSSSSGRLLTQMAKAKYKVFGDINEQIDSNINDYKHISKYPIYNLRYFLANDSIKKSDLPLLDIKLSTAEITKGKEILDAIVKNEKKTICIYTNATGKKCYSEDWWETFYARLKEKYKMYNIIEMLPIENISKISFKAPHFYSKDIREMGAIINNTVVFISADNGVMHLASASQTPTVGFFSRKNINIYKPYGNGSIAIDTNSTSIDEWIIKIDEILKS